MSDQLSRYLQVLINTNRHGGRTIRTDENTVVLYDCGYWSHAHSEALYDRFPCAEMSIVPCDSSLSGFIVVVKARRHSPALLWIAAVFFVAAALILTARHVLRGDQVQ
jgi:hypothetical protein